MTDKKTEALKLALEALELGDDASLAERDQAITAIREALSEQPAQQRHISYVCPQCHWSLDVQPAQQQEPVAMVWYEGCPPFPQDQEWFIAETIYGERVVLRSLDEGDGHKGNYAFITADRTYTRAGNVKRWMQFPDCEYTPPASKPWVGLTSFDRTLLRTTYAPLKTLHHIKEKDTDIVAEVVNDWEAFFTAIEAKLKEKNT